MWKMYYVERTKIENFLNSRKLKPGEFIIFSVKDCVPNVIGMVDLLVYEK